MFLIIVVREGYNLIGSLRGGGEGITPLLYIRFVIVTVILNKFFLLVKRETKTYEGYKSRDLFCLTIIQPRKAK